MPAVRNANVGTGAFARPAKRSEASRDHEFGKAPRC
jgi:hypothetical protein